MQLKQFWTIDKQLSARKCGDCEVQMSFGQ